MKTSGQRVNEESRQQAEAVVAKHLRQLFKRLPMLSGFWLRADLEVAEVTLVIGPECRGGRALCDEVTQSLVQLAEELPEALQLMRGRTFARALH
jgi:hypothetical protein